jgi:hypothetical protein
MGGGRKGGGFSLAERRANPVARTAHLRSSPRHRGGITASSGAALAITETITAHLLDVSRFSVPGNLVV